MKSSHKLAFLPLVSLLMLTGCSQPNMNTPHFENYGNEVTRDIFLVQYKSARTNSLKRFFEIEEGVFYNQTTIKNSLSVKYRVTNKEKTEPKDDPSTIEYSQQSEETKIDILNHRMTNNLKIKKYHEMGYDMSGYRSEIQIGNFYYEEKDYQVYRADLINQTVQKGASNDMNIEFFGQNSFMLVSIFLEYANSLGTENSRYFVNGTTFTGIINDANQDVVLQIGLDEKITIKYKASSYSNYLGTKKEMLTNTEVTLEKYYGLISKVDYKNFR